MSTELKPNETPALPCGSPQAPCYAAQRQYIVTLTAEINVGGFDSDDAVQAPFLSELYKRLRNDGWEVSMEAKPHNAQGEARADNAAPPPDQTL